MIELVCPECNSEAIEPVEAVLVRCVECGLYFDTDDYQEKLQKIPRRRKFDDE